MRETLGQVDKSGEVTLPAGVATGVVGGSAGRRSPGQLICRCMRNWCGRRTSFATQDNGEVVLQAGGATGWLEDGWDDGFPGKIVAASRDGNLDIHSLRSEAPRTDRPPVVSHMKPWFHGMGELTHWPSIDDPC